MPALLFVLVFVHTLFGSPQSHLVHQPARPACCPFGRPGSTHKRLYTHPFPAAAERKLLLNFFSKKLRVQGSALPQPAQGAYAEPPHPAFTAPEAGNTADIAPAATGCRSQSDGDAASILPPAAFAGRFPVPAALPGDPL